MKRTVLCLFLSLVLWSTAGCIVVGSRKGCPRDDGGEVVVYSGNSDAIEEIKAVGKLFSDSDKRDMYKALAARQGLTGYEQSYLVGAVFGNLFSDSAKKGVLLVLINNPEFTCSAKSTILANIQNLFSDSDKKNILSAINDRGPCLDDTEEVEVLLQD